MSKDEIWITIEQYGGTQQENLFIQAFKNHEEADKKSAKDSVFYRLDAYLKDGWLIDDIDIDWTGILKGEDNE